jgi:hypothetical protein
MYFASFPNFVGRFEGTQKIVTDIFTRVAVGKNYSKETVLLMPYTVKDGERIESLAYDLYGSAEYHWVIILVNNMINPRTEWPLSTSDLHKLVAVEYQNIYAVKQYELIKSGIVIDLAALPSYLPEQYVPISHIEYAERENDAKRIVRVLAPKYLAEFVQNFNNEIRG